MYEYDSDYKRKRGVSSGASRRRWLGFGTLGIVIVGLLLAGSTLVLGQLEQEVGDCDITIEIERLDLDGSFKDAYDPLGLGKKVNPDLELYIEVVVYGHFIGEGSELVGERIGDSVYTSQQVKPGDEFTLNIPLRLTISEDEFRDSDILRLKVIIIEIDEVPAMLDDAVEFAFDEIPIPFAGTLLGQGWGELGDWLSANDHVATETILLLPPDEWTNTEISHPGEEDNVDWIHYSLDKKCSIF